MRIEFVDGMTVVHLDKPERRSNTGHIGIHKRKNGVYQVCKGHCMLGWRVTLDEAIALRAEADKRSKDGTFDDWFAQIINARRIK